MSTLSVYEGRDLPPIIQRAIARINDPAILQDMSPTQRWFLSVMLRRVSAEDGNDIFWIKRSNFAKLTQSSEATVYRMLAYFESAGVIKRIAQKRDSDGVFTVGEMRLTEAFCQIIGLTGPTREGLDALYQRKVSDRLAPVSDVINNQGVKQFSSKNHSLHEPSKNTVGKNTAPPDLHRLLNQGLTRPQLFLLMGLAKKQGKRLSDIVAVCSKALQNLNGVELFAYLRTLTTADKDFGFIRQQADQTQQAELAKRERLEKLAQVKSHYRRKWLTGTGDTMFQIDESGRISVYQRASSGKLSGSGTMVGEAEEIFWRRVESGDFKLTEAPPFQMYMN